MHDLSAKAAAAFRARRDALPLPQKQQNAQALKTARANARTLQKALNALRRGKTIGIEHRADAWTRDVCLTVQIGAEKLVIYVGETVTIRTRANHRSGNPAQLAVFEVTDGSVNRALSALAYVCGAQYPTKAEMIDRIFDAAKSPEAAPVVPQRSAAVKDHARRYRL